jgi:AcrR family transcriptional regulator
MSNIGLRERKKQQTRQFIAETAARLFAEHGYEQVAVRTVAREASVAEQTVYNYFGTKEQLVTDRGEEVQARLCALIRERPAGTTAAGAVREFVLADIDGMRALPAERSRGELGYLAAVSPAVRRLALELIDRQACAIAEGIAQSGDVGSAIARLQGIALAGVYRIIIDEVGRRTRDGEDNAAIADAVGAIVACDLDELDRWFAGSPTGPQRRR